MSRESVREHLKQIIAEKDDTSVECFTAIDQLRQMDLEDELTAARADADRLAVALRRAILWAECCSGLLSGEQRAELNWQTLEEARAALAAHEKEKP